MPVLDYKGCKRCSGVVLFDGTFPVCAYCGWEDYLTDTYFLRHPKKKLKIYNDRIKPYIEEEGDEELKANVRLATGAKLKVSWANTEIMCFICGRDQFLYSKHGTTDKNEVYWRTFGCMHGHKIKLSVDKIGELRWASVRSR